MKNKDKLDQLQAKITLMTGRKPTQQELLDYCVEYSSRNIDDFINLLNTGPILNKEKVDRILKKRSQRMAIPYDNSLRLNPDDEEIYS